MGGRALACVKHPDQEESDWNGTDETGRFFLAYALQGMVFYNPIATLYRLQAGVTLTQMQVIEGISPCWSCWGWKCPGAAGLTGSGTGGPWYSVLRRAGPPRWYLWRAETVMGLWRNGCCFAQAGLSGCDTAYLYACCRDPEEHRLALPAGRAYRWRDYCWPPWPGPLLGGDYRLRAADRGGAWHPGPWGHLTLREPEGQRAEEQAWEPRPPLGEMLRESREDAGLSAGVALFDQTAPGGSHLFSQGSSTGRCGLQRGLWSPGGPECRSLG